MTFAKRRGFGFRLKAGMTGSGRLIKLAMFGASRSLIETEVTVRKGILCTSPGSSFKTWDEAACDVRV